MSAPKTKTRAPLGRVRIMLGILVLSLVGIGVMMHTLMGRTGAEAAQASPTPAPTATASPTPVPTPSPEPTPVLPDVDIDGWELQMIRYEYPLGEDFAPEELTDVGDGQRMDSRVAPAIEELIADAKEAGYGVYVCSGYRDYDTQYSIYWNHIYEYRQQGKSEEEAHELTRLAVNYPGCSEHQSGLCVDILEYYGQDMEPYIGGSGLMLWLEKHCAEYGFVVRYPDGKTDITGVEYEPWHLRYVGKTAAEYITENGLCLEEFLGLYGVELRSEPPEE